MVSLNDIQQLEIQPLSSSSRQPLYMLTYRDRHFEISEPVAELVELLKTRDSIEEISIVFSRKKGQSYSSDQIQGLIKEFIQPVFEESDTQTNSYIWLKKVFISGERLKPLTHYLRFLFKPAAVYTLLFLIGAGLGYMFFIDSTLDVAANDFNLTSFLFVGSLYFGSVIFHELGHASACRYYGVEHGHIGVGLYLHFPVFYADVSNVWKLARKQRIVVDLAGIYFQLVFLLPFIVAYMATGNADLNYVIIAVCLSFLFDLNPFFRFDGYWVFTDLLGVANLRQRTYEVIGYVAKKLSGRTVPETPYLFTIKSREKVFFIGYVIVSNLFFGYYILYRMPLFLYEFVKTVPGYLAVMVESITTGNPFPFELLGSILMQLTFIGLTLYILYKVGVRIYQLMARKFI